MLQQSLQTLLQNGPFYNVTHGMAAFEVSEPTISELRLEILNFHLIGKFEGYPSCNQVV